MRFMIIVKSSKDSEAGVMPGEALLAQMAAYHEELAQARVLVDGYTIINVKSLQEAIEWTKRFPNPAGNGNTGEIEVRQLFELEDFGDSAAVDRFRERDIARRNREQ